MKTLREGTFFLGGLGNFEFLFSKKGVGPPLRFNKNTSDKSATLPSLLHGMFQAVGTSEHFTCERKLFEYEYLRHTQFSVYNSWVSLTWSTAMFFNENKENVCIIIEFNSRRIGSGHEHSRRFIVWGHQYGGRASCEIQEYMFRMTNIHCQLRIQMNR